MRTRNSPAMLHPKDSAASPAAIRRPQVRVLSGVKQGWDKVPTPALLLTGESLSEFAHANSLAVPQDGPGCESCRAYREGGGTATPFSLAGSIGGLTLGVCNHTSQQTPKLLCTPLPAEQPSCRA